jgi:hypothetical protein
MTTVCRQTYFFYFLQDLGERVTQQATAQHRRERCIVAGLITRHYSFVTTKMTSLLVRKSQARELAKNYFLDRFMYSSMTLMNEPATATRAGQ